MNKLKERLFGLIVVIALGVIFIPMLLENTQNPNSNVLQDVPAASLAKNDVDKAQKPEVLAELKNEKTQKPVVYDESQPISDASDALKAKQKEAAIEEEKAAQAKAELAKAEQVKADLAKAEQQKLEKIKLEEAKAQSLKIEEDKRRQLEIEKAKAEQAKLEEEKRQLEQAEIERIKTEQVKKEQQKAELAKVEKSKAEQTQAELAKIEQVKAEQARFLQEKRAAELAEKERSQQVQIEHKETRPVTSTRAVEPKAHTQKSTKVRQHGWVVQMGSFVEPHNASALLKKLRRAGYPAFTRNAFRQGMELTIVMVGPHVSRADAERLCSTLSMKFQIDGIIVRYEPH